MIGQNPKAEVALFSSAEIGIKNIRFEDRDHRERTEELMPNSGGRGRTGVFRSAVDVIRWIETVTEIPVKTGENLWQGDDSRLQAKLYTKNPASP